MKQDDATGAGAQKGIRRLGNRRGGENQVGGVLFYQVAIGAAPVEGDDDASIVKLLHRRGVRDLLDVDAAHFCTRIRQTGEGEAIPLELPGRSGKSTGGHEEPQQGVVQGW